MPAADWLEPQKGDRAGCGAGYLVMMTMLAALLRFWRLDAMSLWIDEVFTWNLADPIHGPAFVDLLRAAYQGPLYPFVARPLLHLHESAWLFRLPAALAGTMAVPLVGVFAARLQGRMAGRLAALLLAISPFAVWYAQEGRGYSFLILFAAAAGLVLLSALAQGPTRGRMLALALLGFFGLASNTSFLFLLVAFGLTVLFVARPRRPRDWALWAGGLGGGVVLAMPWLLTAAGIWELGRVLPGAETGESLRGETTFTFWALPFSAQAFFYGFSLGPSLLELHGSDRLDVVRQHLPLLLLGGFVAAGAVVAGLVRLHRRHWFLTLWIAVPLVLVVLLAWRNIKPFNVRYLAAAFPWILVLAASGIAGAGRWARLVLGSGLSLLFLVSLAGHYHDDRYAKEDVRGAVAAIEASAQPERPILVPAVGPVVHHYWKGASQVIGMYTDPVIRDAAMAEAAVQRRLAGHDEVWVVWGRSWVRDPYGLLPAALARHGSLERIHTGPGVAVDLWRRLPEGGSAGSEDGRSENAVREMD